MNTTKEFMQWINKNYIPGVIDFYAKTPGDPWQKVLDDLEQDLLKFSYSQQYFVNLKESLFKAKNKIEILLNFYKETQSPSKEPNALDAFMMGSSYYSKSQTKICSVCDEEILSENLKKRPKISTDEDGNISFTCYDCINKSNQGEFDY